MPSKTKKQHNLMAMCSTTKGRKKAKVKCPPKTVAREFVAHDKSKKLPRRT